MNIDALVGGLIGSLLTVMVTKLLDLLQQAKEHKYALQRVFFEKKLAVAESAFSNYFSTASTLNSLAALYEHFSEPSDRLSGETFESFNSMYVDRLRKAEDALHDLSNSLFMYFDVNLDSLGNTTSLKKLYDVLSDIQNLLLSDKILAQLMDQSQGTKNQSKLMAKRDEVWRQIFPKMKEFSQLMNDSKQEMVKLLKNLRSEMKKYET